MFKLHIICLDEVIANAFSITTNQRLSLNSNHKPGYSRCSDENLEIRIVDVINQIARAEKIARNFMPRCEVDKMSFSLKFPKFLLVQKGAYLKNFLRVMELRLSAFWGQFSLPKKILIRSTTSLGQIDKTSHLWQSTQRVLLDTKWQNWYYQDAYNLS